MPSDKFVSIKELAKRLGIDHRYAIRYVRKLGYSFHNRRTSDSRNQLTLCVTSSEAEGICSQRRTQGFEASTVVAVPEIGVFYVIQLVPELDPKRLKLGFAESINQRLSQHRTACPTARVLRAWPCKRSWEITALDALPRVGCRLINNEVFECEDPQALVERGNAFFSMLPQPGDRIPLAESSPLNQASNTQTGTENQSTTANT
jgi:hypothetical protein